MAELVQTFIQYNPSLIKIPSSVMPIERRAYYKKTVHLVYTVDDSGPAYTKVTFSQIYITGEAHYIGRFPSDYPWQDARTELQSSYLHVCLPGNTDAFASSMLQYWGNVSFNAVVNLPKQHSVSSQTLSMYVAHTYVPRQTTTVSISVGKRKSYSISYNANGGSNPPSSQTTKWHDERCTLSSTKPTRTGHNFSKWTTNRNGSGTSYNPGDPYTANADATLYAQWTPHTYVVKYYANGGTGAPGGQTKTYGVDLKLSNVKPKLTGYTFKGWATSQPNANNGQATYQPGAIYRSDSPLNLYAVWELNHVNPTISNVIVERCTWDEEEQTYTMDDEGTCAKVTFSWTVFRSTKKRYYSGGETSYSNNTIDTDGCYIKVGNIGRHYSSTNASGIATVYFRPEEDGEDPFNQDTQYSVSISLRDSVNINPSKKTTTATSRLVPTFFPMDFNKDASAMGIFRPAPENGNGIYLGKTLYVRGDIVSEPVDMRSQIELGSGVTAGSYTRLDRIGKLVIFNMNYQITDPTSAQIILSNLPKPVSNVAFSAASGGKEALRMYIDTSGNVKWDGTYPSATQWVNGSVTYITSE